MKTTHPSTKIMIWAVVIAIFLTAAFFYIYWYYPLPGDWNDTILNFSFTLASALTAGVATLIYRCFGRDEAPRRVWLNLAVGLWGWVLAESIWAVLALFIEVPDVSWADLLWVGAYFFLASAFVYQFRIVTRPSRAHESKWLVITLAIVLLGSALVTMLARILWVSEQTWFETYVSVYYVFADLTLAVAALKLARLFGRGALGHAWIGLLAFAISDILYSVLLITGLYAQSAKSDSILSMFADAVYFDAYLVSGLALLSFYLLLRFGPKPIPTSYLHSDTD